MRITTLGRIFGLVVLAAATPLMTSSVYKLLAGEEMRRPTAQAVRPDKVAASTTVAEIDNPTERAPSKLDPTDKHTEASFRMEECRVQLVGPDVLVEAKAGLFHKAPGAKCFWGVHVWCKDKDNNLAKATEKFYLDQIFDVGGRGVLTPDFTESIRLPNGDYSVQVALYLVPDYSTPQQNANPVFLATNSSRLASRHGEVRVLNN